MNTTNLLRVSGMVLLALVVSLAFLLIVYTLQNPVVMVNLASIGWNGFVSP